MTTNNKLSSTNFNRKIESRKPGNDEIVHFRGTLNAPHRVEEIAEDKSHRIERQNTIFERLLNVRNGFNRQEKGRVYVRIVSGSSSGSVGRSCDRELR